MRCTAGLASSSSIRLAAMRDAQERVSMWGMGGYGEGTLTVTPEGQAPLRPDMDFVMGALGVRGVLVDGGHDGPTLAAKSDAYAVRTSTDAVSGSAGNLEASQAGVTRVRFALEGSRPFGLGGGAVLTPSLELGVRHDGGDAETGTGVEAGAEAGAGIHYSAGAFSIEGQVHTLIAHEDSGYEDWGASGALRVNPSPSGRGLSLSLAPVWGNASPGSEGLWSARDATAFALEGSIKLCGVKWGQPRRLNLQAWCSNASGPFGRRTVSPFDPTQFDAS